MKIPKPDLLILDSKYFYAGCVSNKRGIITRAAPIIKWAIGRHKDQVLSYAKRKGWKIIRR